MSNPVFERIEADIKANPVVLFMKGTPVFPQCGFSARVVQILSHMGVPFKGVNVLEDMEILSHLPRIFLPEYLLQQEEFFH